MSDHDPTRRFRQVVAAALLAASLALNSFAITLDPAFATGGKFITTFSSTGTPSSYATRVFRQPSGRIVLVGGHSELVSASRIGGLALAGLTPAGVPDPTFGTAGKVLVWDGISNVFPTDALMNTDGSLLLLSQMAVGATSSPRLVRRTADGGVGAGFSADLEIDVNQTVPLRMSLGVGGKIYVLLRKMNTAVYYLVRLHGNGARDASFGSNGVRVLNVQRLSRPEFAGVHELPNGKLIIAGHFDTGNFETDMFAARFDTDGNLDRTFGLQGIARVNIPGGSIWTMTSSIQPDGKILVGGSWVFLGSTALLVRLTPRGRLDTGFGSGGIASHFIDNTNVIRGIALTSDGTITVAGSCGAKAIPPNARMFVARYSAAGVRESFLLTNFITTRDSGGYDIAMQPDGNFVAAGFSVNPSDNFSQFAAARFVP